MLDKISHTISIPSQSPAVLVARAVPFVMSGFSAVHAQTFLSPSFMLIPGQPSRTASGRTCGRCATSSRRRLSPLGFAAAPGPVSINNVTKGGAILVVSEISLLQRNRKSAHIWTHCFIEKHLSPVIWEIPEQRFVQCSVKFR